MAEDTNFLRHPLDQVLGTEANVRLLRLLLHEVDGPLGAPDAAERTGLTAAGARKALARLSRGGFLTMIGGGRSQQYAPRQGEPLLDSIREIFRTELVRYETLLRLLRTALQEVPEVQLAWIDRLPSKLGEPLEITVVGHARALPWLKDEIRSRIRQVEKDFDVIVELAAYSKADAPDLEPEQTILLAGHAPSSPDVTSRPPTHHERDERALRMSRALAVLLRADPSIIKRAVRHLDRVLVEDQGLATQDLVEWRQILETYSPERLQDFLRSKSSRAARLRQSSPFFAVLSAVERDALIEFLEKK